MQDAEYPSSVAEHLSFWRERRMRAQSEVEHKRLGMFVYVVQGDPNTPIKIGVAVNPLKRLRGLQTGNWQTLRLLHVIPGNHQLEAAFHRQLEGARVQGEWFSGPEAEEFLEWVADYCQRAVSGYLEKRELPAIPGPPARRNHKPGPVTIRFVEPNPPTPEEIAERGRRHHEGFDRLPEWAHRALTPSQHGDNYGRRGPR